MKRNPHVAKLGGMFLFDEVVARKAAFQAAHPDVKLLNLGIGDYTRPLPKCVTTAMSSAARKLGTKKGFTGYGATQGDATLRQAICDTFYQGRFDKDDIHLSDGILPDLGRLQLLFGAGATIAIQDPTYPGYINTSVIVGQTGGCNTTTGHFDNVVYMPATPETNFFPDLSRVPRTDVIYFCSPNNPTGVAATRQQMQTLVDFARKNRSIIVYDSAYIYYKRTPDVPSSIYEIPGAEDVAIEMGTFSKMAGFTGLRLGWSVFPKNLKYDDGNVLSRDWFWVYSRMFNGSASTTQAGGIAALSSDAQKIYRKNADAFLANAQILKETFLKLGFQAYGAEDCPYAFVKFPGKTSWEAFQDILERCHIVTIPGSGFGKGGEGFVRFSGFGDLATTRLAVKQLRRCLCRTV